MNNILIVEDEHLIARLIEMTLTRAGYRCTLAEDGRTAADLIETTNFDMALLDIMLPGMDGLSLCETVMHCWNVCGPRACRSSLSRPKAR